MGGARLSEHGWGGLSDLYEPYLLPKEKSGKSFDCSKYEGKWKSRCAVLLDFSGLTEVSENVNSMVPKACGT